MARRPLLLLLLAGCGTATPLPPPALELPAMPQAAEDLTTWWTRFGDPQLQALIAHVLEQNRDLAAAAARVDESAALLRNSDDLLPEANLRASAGRSQTSDRNAFPRFAGIDRRNSAHSLGIDVVWEADLWGRVRAAHGAAAADLRASRAALHGFSAALAAQAAQAYFRLLALDLKLALHEATLQNRADARRIQARRLQAGTGSQLEAAQAEADYQAVAAALPRLRQAQQSALRALLVLAGASPREIAAAELPRAALLPPAPEVPGGLPADLLARRPDIVEAEAELAAATLRVDEARARYFPTIRLTASGGQESKDLGDLLTSPATVWNFAAGLTQPLFGLRKIGAQVDAAQARATAAEAAYVGTVQRAFAEIHDALQNRSTSRAALDALQLQQAALQAAERFAAARHGAGSGSFLDLLDARRNLLAVQSQSIDSAADELVATIDVYRSLGGGWAQ